MKLPLWLHRASPAICILFVAGCLTMTQVSRLQIQFSKLRGNNHVTALRRALPKKMTAAVEYSTPIIPVMENDFIYSSEMGAAPIVIESQKLIFFFVTKNSCTVWKQLFRRMLGFEDWKTKSPHDLETNGLTYLNMLDRSYATEIMNDPTWTRAMFVRDPKERLLSAYLDKVIHDNSTYTVEACCADNHECWEQVQTFSGFVDVTNQCYDRHWEPQSHRIDAKFLPLLNFMGRMDDVAEDAKRLLQTIGAWEDFGATGWGNEGTEYIFESRSSVQHATSNSREESWNRLSQYYTPELEEIVEARYHEDYDQPLYQLDRRKIDFSSRPATTPV